MSQTAPSAKPCTILVIKGQGIGPECIEATKTVLAATGLPLTYVDGTLGYPDADDLFRLLQQHAPAVYTQQFGSRAPSAVAVELETLAKDQAYVDVSWGRQMAPGRPTLATAGFKFVF